MTIGMEHWQKFGRKAAKQATVSRHRNVDLSLIWIRPDWINDKESSKFFFPGICWERSLIPLDVWNAGDAHSNLIESVHRDVNREGVHCTLLGGLKKGQLFDALKMKTLAVGLFIFNQVPFLIFHLDIRELWDNAILQNRPHI